MSYQFKGDNKALVSSITALLSLDAKGALVPHGIGEMARQLLESSSARLAEQHQGEPVCWVNDQQLLLCSKSPRVVEPDNPLTHNLPRNIAGSALQGEYCNTPLFRHADSGEVVALRDAYLRAGEREHELRTELARLRTSLKFYADRDHFSTDDGLNWDSCSGEPANILWHESEPWFIEDGAIARAALEGNRDDDIPDFTPGKGNKAERRATQLLAQLQTDLTQRDNQSDQMRVLLQHLVYDYRAAIQAGYDKITALGGDCDSISKMLADNPNYQKAMALLLPDLESRPEERGTPETEPCSGCGAPGWTGACTKCVPY